MSRWEQEIEAVFQDMVAWRRHFHQHPELSFQEKKTSQKVYDMLREWGIEARRGTEGYWVEGTIYGASPGPTVALRADMDALPIQDEKKVPYASRVREVMHACGHDAHTAQLLGVAKVLQQNRSRLKGNVRLIFQHAEEVCPGGALTVIREGGLDGVDVIFGVHLWTPIPVGYVAATEGPCMASADEFRIEIRGKGGHGGLPHETVDPIVVASHLVVHLQTIVSRSVDPSRACVVSVGSMHAGDSFNVIPDTCVLNGTVRTFEEPLRNLVRKRLTDIAERTASMYGAEAKVAYENGYPPVVNTPSEAERFFRVGGGLFGQDRATRLTPVMAGEDFAYYLHKVPGCFMFVGAGNEKAGADAPHHHPRFDIDEQAMKHAAKLLVGMTLDYAAHSV